MQAIGGLSCGLDIFNKAVIPMLLYNSEMFTDMNKETLDELEQIQILFLPVLLGVPMTCPRPALQWNTKFLKLLEPH